MSRSIENMAKEPVASNTGTTTRHAGTETPSQRRLPIQIEEEGDALGGWKRDLDYAVRRLRNNKSFALLVILVLALGIGANSSIFSIIDAVLLHPLPYHDANRLVVLWVDNPKQNVHEEGTGYPTFQDWQRENQVFDAIGGYIWPERMNVTTT